MINIPEEIPASLFAVRSRKQPTAGIRIVSVAGLSATYLVGDRGLVRVSDGSTAEYAVQGAVGRK